MDSDRRKIELMNSLLLSFPGTPILYYGDEIGMGDNIYLGDRNGCARRCNGRPIATADSRCDPARLCLPMIMDPVYGFEAVNVEAQSRSLASLLSWTKRLISVRKSHNVFGRGSRPSSARPTVPCWYVRQYENDVVLCVANLSRSAQAAEIDLSPWRGRVPFELLGGPRSQRSARPPTSSRSRLMGSSGSCSRSGQLDDRRCDHAGRIRDDRHAARLAFAAAGTSEIGAGAGCPSGFSLRRRWFAERGNTSTLVQVDDAITLVPGDPGLGLALVEAKGKRETATYLLPLTVKWTRFDPAHPHPNALAAVRRGPREGTLLDATADPGFISFVLENLQKSQTLEAGERCFEFKPTDRLPPSRLIAPEEVRAVDAEQSNTTVLVGNDYVVKLFLPDRAGLNPEIEVGRSPKSCRSPTRRRCSEPWNCKSTTSAAQSRSSTASCRTKATPGPSPAPISTASSRSRDCSRPRRPAIATSRSPMSGGWSRSANAWPRCSWPSPAAAISPISLGADRRDVPAVGAKALCNAHACSGIEAAVQQSDQNDGRLVDFF
jgi:maltose alpha-D-glucosyltransferase/alpha-amylase